MGYAVEPLMLDRSKVRRDGVTPEEDPHLFNKG